MGEFDLIARIQQRLLKRESDSRVLLGIGDDAALLMPPAGLAMALTSDTLNADVHFWANHSPRDIGYKCLAVNLSDLAAMGATPWWFNLNLSLPSLDLGWIDAFLDGLEEAMDSCGIVLVGGDTTRGPLSISISAAGLVDASLVLRRDGARAGQDLWVTGALGDAAYALREPSLATPAQSLALHRPSPRIEFGRSLLGLATAAADISDGLISDASHIAARSNVRIEIDMATIPRSTVDVTFNDALSGGDDYELVFTADATHRDALQVMASQQGLRLTRVGRVLAGAGVCVIDADGSVRSEVSTGFDHFQ